MTEKTWAEILKKAEKAQAHETHKKNVFKKFTLSLRRFLTFELLIGIVAALILYAGFGWTELQRILLSWIIGITMVSTMITFMVNRYNKLLHFKK
jgi:hypothetical protein